MWRRVASQSPVEPPKDKAAAEQGRRYSDAWDALGKLLADGRSLSGREANCCFLNTGQPRFADVSAASGFDFPDDARGLAFVDWDGDGDLDVWTSNRTAPRARFLKNDYDAGNHFLALKLQGVECNRDAVGARVEVVPRDAAGKKLVRSLHAGEGYLAQSSKWLIFGLGADAASRQVVVHWPGGRREAFDDVSPDGRYVLVQGSGQARPEPAAHGVVHLAASTFQPPTSPVESRIVLPARLPLPDLACRALDSEQSKTLLDERTSGPVLINLWATWCAPCVKEISDWVAHEREFRAAGVRVVLVCVDDAGSSTSASADPNAMLDELKVAFERASATPELLDQLDVVQRLLTKRQRSLPVPTSFLVDAQGRLAVLYKGPVEVAQLLEDIGQLTTPDERQRDLAVAQTGRWYTNPFPPDLLAIPRRYYELGRTTAALDYLERHVKGRVVANSQANDETVYESISAENLGDIYVGLGMQLQQQNDREGVVRALESAVEVQPDNAKARMALAMIFQQDGRTASAVAQYRALLQLRRGDPVISNNLAWLLATSGDAAVRDPAAAIELAEVVCRQTGRNQPSTLDTLAAAYAAAGRFDDAVKTAGEAIAILEQAQADAGTLRQRRQLYRQRKPYLEP